jgi:hypothetical protein
MIPNNGVGDFDRILHGSPSPVSSPFNRLSSLGGTGFGVWGGPHPEVLKLLLI